MAGLRKPRKVIAIVGLGAALIITAGLLVTGAFRPHDAAGSRVLGLVCNENAHDFGPMTIKEAAEREHTFVLTNTSDRPIKIVKQSSTCGCTVVTLPKGTVVPPAGDIKVPVKADWRSRPGAQSAVVTILTDDSKTPSVDLVVSGFVKCPAVVTPAVVNFGLLKAGQQATRVVELHPGTDPRPFCLTAIENPSNMISISRVPEKAGEQATPPLEGGPGKFLLQITGPRTGGREETRIVFRTDLVDRPEVLLEVLARFEGSLVAAPQSVFFNGTIGESVILRDVRIRSSQGDADFDPKAEILWKGSSEKPFFLKRIAGSRESLEPEVVVTVGFNCKHATKSIDCATLRIICESDSLDIPMIAMGWQED